MNFKIYIGLTTKDNKYLNENFVINQVAKLSDDFIVTKAQGYYNGERENYLVFEFYNQCVDSLKELQDKLEQLSFDCNQECIGFYNCKFNNFYLIYSKNHIVIDNNDDEYFTEHWLFNI